MAALMADPAKAYACLETDERGLLALVAAHADAFEGGAVSWHALNAYVEQVVRMNDGLELVAGRGVTKQLALVANQLMNKGFVRVSTDGLTLSDDAAAMRGDWNVAFADLVAHARKVVDKVA